MNDTESQQVVDELKEFQSKIYDKLKGIKVKYDISRNADVFNAIEKLFGAQTPNSPNYGYITFDTYIKCLDIVKKSGELKAESIINRELHGI